ncbi:MAG TPA: hypothetical protein ENN39_10165 [Desulfonatronum sp.]|nr:hypothetical protein [Desulfonatronum sp.]
MAEAAEHYEDYLVRKYGHGSRELSAEQVTEQFLNLARCKRDSVMFKQLLDYFALLENYKKAAQADGRTGEIHNIIDSLFF